MKNFSEKSVVSILTQQNTNSILAFIQKKVGLLNQLNELWVKVALDLAQYSRVANFRDKFLIIEVDNASWATRLRYLVPELKKKLLHCPLLTSLQDIKWYIQPNLPKSPKKDPLTPILSTYNAQLLKATAVSLQEKKLREALLRLSKKN